MALAYSSDGSGPALVLLHAFGLSSKAWRPVVPLLTPHRRVITVDLPGHGDSPMPPPDVPASPRGYAVMVGRLLDDLGLDTVAVAGNSIGGWTALELARAGRASSVVALSPAGLWPSRESRIRLGRFIADQIGARVARPILPRLLSTAAGRAVLLGSAMSSARSLPTDDAVALVNAYADTQDVLGHIRDRWNQRFTGGRDLTIPITVAWGSEDQFITAEARSHDELPTATRWIELPDCGHVMMWDAPELVASTILEGTQED